MNEEAQIGLIIFAIIGAIFFLPHAIFVIEKIIDFYKKSNYGNKKRKDRTL